MHAAMDEQMRPSSSFTVARVRGEIPVPVPGIVEICRYTSHPGQRDALIASFERDLSGGRDVADLNSLGLFHDLDHPDRCVWLRGFTSAENRRQALARRHPRAAWHAQAGFARNTLRDSTHLLLSVRHGPVPDEPRLPPAMEPDGAHARLAICLHYFDRQLDAGWLSHFEQVQRPWLEDLRARVVCTLVSAIDPHRSSAPARVAGAVFASMVQFTAEANLERCDRQLQAPWRIGTQPRRSELLRLEPARCIAMGRERVR